MDSMSKKTQKRYWISSARQIKALTSPVRHQMHLVMEMLGPCSVRELASRMGREPATLYYHVKLLERVGIITRSGTRGAGRNEEIVYALAQEHVRVDMNQRSEIRQSAGKRVRCSTSLRRTDVCRRLEERRNDQSRRGQ